MNRIQLLLCLLLSMSFFQGLSQDSTKNCQVLRNGKFKYVDAPDTSVYIIISGNSHTEFYNEGKYYIKSKIRWTGECSYVMTMTEITLPDFPYHPGDRMEVDVTRIENGIIYYTSTVNERTWQGRMKIISP